MRVPSLLPHCHTPPLFTFPPNPTRRGPPRAGREQKAAQPCLSVQLCPLLPMMMTATVARPVPSAAACAKRCGPPSTNTARAQTLLPAAPMPLCAALLSCRPFLFNTRRTNNYTPLCALSPPALLPGPPSLSPKSERSRGSCGRLHLIPPGLPRSSPHLIACVARIFLGPGAPLAAGLRALCSTCYRSARAAACLQRTYTQRHYARRRAGGRLLTARSLAAKRFPLVALAAQQP